MNQQSMTYPNNDTMAYMSLMSCLTLLSTLGKRYKNLEPPLHVLEKHW